MKPEPQIIARLPIPTADGEFVASYSSHGLCRLEFPSKQPARNSAEGVSPSPQVREWHAQTSSAVRAVLSGGNPASLPPLDLNCGTDFQQRVWQQLRRIAAGETLSYAGVAAAIGSPKATRAVGGACGANPIPLLIPCHRVLAANQKIGGFSGGLHWKRLLLGRERR